MNEKQYTDDGFLVVTETDTCPLWEQGERSKIISPLHDCFFCKYSDFRTIEFIQKVENVPKTGKWQSPCHNPKNKRADNQNNTKENQ